MRTTSDLARPLAAVAALALVAGCGTRQLNPPGETSATSSAAAWLAKKSASYVYTCQNVAKSIDCRVFVKNKLSQTITKNLKKPLGLVAGKDGRVYVADAGAKAVLVFAAGMKTLTTKLSDGKNVPADVAVYQDELAVANQTNVTFFAKGAKAITRTLSDSNATKGTGTAFDTAGNCYYAFVNKSSNAEVDEFKGCSGSPTNLNISAGSPYGIAFDGKNNLYYTSYSSYANGVYACTGTSSCARLASSFINPQYLNFAANFTDLWVNETGDYQCYCEGLYELDPSSGKTVTKILEGMSFFDPPSGAAAGPGSL